MRMLTTHALTCCLQLWGDERITELAKLAGRAVLCGICKTIFPTLLKQACAGCSSVPVVEVWDGNVKDTVKVDGANVKWLQGQMLAMAQDVEAFRSGPPEQECGNSSNSSSSNPFDEFDDSDGNNDAEGQWKQEVDQMVASLAQSGKLPFPGGMHAYEVWLVPVKIMLISVGHFGRQSSLLAPKTNIMQLLRPRAILVANRADVQHAAPPPSGWLGHCKDDNELPDLNQHRIAKLVLDSLQSVWKWFLCSYEVDVEEDLDRCESEVLEQYRSWFAEAVQKATPMYSDRNSDEEPPGLCLNLEDELDAKTVRAAQRVCTLSVPDFRRWMKAMYARFSEKTEACHKCVVKGGCLLATCGCTAAITTVREQLTGVETTRRVAHGALDGKRLRSPVLVYDNGCGLAATITSAYLELRGLMKLRKGGACSLEELLASKASASTEFPWSGGANPWKELCTKAQRVFTSDFDRRVLDVMEKPSLLNEHPLTGVCCLLILIDRFHQSNHSSLTCQTYSMRLVAELAYVISQNVEHRWRQKSASLGFLHHLHPEAHEVVSLVMDWGWCDKSFNRQVAKLRPRVPPGCDLAYNVMQQVQSRCVKCGSAPTRCGHTGASCTHILVASAALRDRTGCTTLSDAWRALRGDCLQCDTASEQTGEPPWSARVTDLPTPHELPAQDPDLPAQDPGFAYTW